jgi:hypothetical protein
MGDQIAPRLVNKPSLNQDDDGNRLTINCEVEASPKPDVVWFKDNKQIALSSRITSRIDPVATNTFGLYLHINDVTAGDSGVYKASIRNGLGESSASITLNFAGESSRCRWIACDHLSTFLSRFR